MKKIVKKFFRFFKIIFAVLNLLINRIKKRNETPGIAQVVDSFNSGGLEQVAVNVYKAFKKEKYNSSVISVSNNVGPICQQLDSPADLRIIYYDIIDMLNYCANKNIKTLIFHFSTFHMIFFKMLGFKNYYVVHNTYIWYSNKEWKNLKIKLKFTDGIIAVSKWCKKYFENKTGILNIKLILNGIDFDNINKGEICSITRKSLKIKENDIICFTLGSYTEGKHQMEIIGIMEKLIKQNRNLKYICAGPILNPNYYKKFIKRLEKSTAKNSIIPLNYIPQSEVGDFIRKNCDIYIQPSIHEAGVPLTVMEALLNGKPVVMTDFMIKDTFPNSSRIYSVTPPYKDILSITPKMASSMGEKVIDSSTEEFINKIQEIINNLDYYKNSNNFNIKDYEFLHINRMASEYVKFIKTGNRGKK